MTSPHANKVLLWSSLVLSPMRETISHCPKFHRWVRFCGLNGFIGRFFRNGLESNLVVRSTILVNRIRKSVY